MFKGIDVSVWQGDINFELVRADEVEAVYIRAGEGANIVDRYFESNYRKAKASGLKYGFYHYVTARSRAEAEEQADFFANLIHTKPHHMRAAMDFENLSGLSHEEAVAIAKAYLQRLKERLRHTPAVYSDAYDAEYVWRSHLTEYPLWVAEYGVREPQHIGGWQRWSGFQYSSRGSVRGIRGHVDMDYFEDTILLTDSEQQSAREIRHRHSYENDGCPHHDHNPDYITYTVRAGDTLWDIARRYNTTVEELVRINHISNPDLIHVGEILRIPRR